MKLHFIVLCLLFSVVAVAQNSSTTSDTIILIVYEKTTTSPDQPHLPATSQSSLIIDGKVSYYFISNPYHVTNDGNKLIPSNVKFVDSNYLVFNQPMMPKYDRFTYFSDTLHPMKWELTGKKIDLNGRIGYGATTHFRGRKFTAYYDPNIPFSNGPVKFGGLPGLIIKLFDSDNIWDFELKTITREKRSFKISKMNVVGNYQNYLGIYPEWRRKLEEKLAAESTTDPNCPTCGSKSTHYSLEIYE